ncbi:MAG: hypothetical protein Kow0059_02690 [Candidatus Sumerlaeia bacterium]
MSVLRQYFRNFNLNISPIQLGEIVIIVGVLVFAAYILYSLNLFKKGQ